jgi:hypothetical protein
MKITVEIETEDVHAAVLLLENARQLTEDVGDRDFHFMSGGKQGTMNMRVTPTYNTSIKGLPYYIDNRTKNYV